MAYCPAFEKHLFTFLKWIIVAHVMIREANSQVTQKTSGQNKLQKEQPSQPAHPLQIHIQSKFPVLFFDLDVVKTVTMNYTLQCDHPSTVYLVMAKSVNEDIATIIAGNPVTITCTNRNDSRGFNSDNEPNESVLIHENVIKKLDRGNTVVNGSDATELRGIYETNHDDSGQTGREKTNGMFTMDKNATQESDKERRSRNSTDAALFEVRGEFVMTFESHHIGRSFFLMFATKINGPGSQSPLRNMMMKLKDNGSMMEKMKHQHQPHYGNKSNSNIFMANSKSESNPAYLHNKPKRQNDAQISSLRPNSQKQGASQEQKGPPMKPKTGGPGASGLPPNTVVKTMIIVMKMPGFLDQVFRVVLYIVIISVTIGMGIKVEIEVIVKVLKKPLGPCIGLVCQYLCMPLIAYLVAKTVPQPSAAISLGIFTCGIVPGGGASNMYCYLLGGDVSLSVTMTTISSVLALGLIPMWMFTLGETFGDENADIYVPYTKILETLAIVLLPVFAGMIIKYKSPKAAKIISKILKPFIIITCLFLISVGIYVNFYIFSMIKPMQILAGCLLPYIGYLVGGTIALIFRQSWTHVKTIAIETGIQNTGIAFLMVFFSLPPPDNQLAVVAPAASSIMTPLPLLLITFFYVCYQRRQNKKKYGTVPDGEKEKGDDFNNEEKHLEPKEKEASVSGEKLTIWDKVYGRQRHEKTPTEVMLTSDILVNKDMRESFI